VKVAARSYDNSLRAEQAAATRDRIVDAAIEVLSEGADKLSIPAVANAAAVSVPTVYRHFPSKEALVDAVYDRYADRIDATWHEGVPNTLDDYVAMIPTIFGRHEHVAPDLRTAMSGPEGAKVRRRRMAERLERVDTVLDDTDLSAADREQMRDLLVVLTSSAVQRAFREYLGLGPDVAAERVAWAIRRLTASPKKTNAKKR